jgi:hypothetical protein
MAISEADMQDARRVLADPVNNGGPDEDLARWARELIEQHDDFHAWESRGERHI